MFLLLAATAAVLPQAADPEGVEFFEKKIRPVLVGKCYECHSAGAKKLKGGLKLDTRDDVLKGGDTGPALVAGDPEKSLLVKAVRHADEDLKMPPKERLSDAQIADFEAWIKRGAPDPRTGTAAKVDPSAGRSHWAFQKPKEAAVPPVSSAAWAKTEVDRFVLAALEKMGMKPQPEAERRTLIRRASMDLLGLPPTAEEVDAFVADRDPQAYEKLVDRLLASPHYGERWARHWLDVARYSDTKGYVFQEERRYPFAYTYRDWVVRALNEDLPYDQFLIQQIAADRLPLGADKRPLAAMGFFTLGRRFLNRVEDIIDDRIDVLTRGTMGLTVSCARCHDHKYDPIPTRDYYSLYGVFASSMEPKDLPLIGAGQKTPAVLEYEQGLEKLKAELEKYKQDRLAEKLKLFRTAKSVADYLAAAGEAGALKDENALRDFGQKRDLSGFAAVRWNEYLKKAGPKHPVFGPWLAYAALPAGDFEAKAKVLKLPEGTNPLVAAAFKEAPKSLQEAADRTGALLVKFDKPEKLADANEEALRLVLRAPEGPVTVAFADVEKLYNRKDRDGQRGVERKIEQHKASHPGAPEHAMVLNDAPNPVTPRVFVRGNPRTPGPEVPRRFLSVLAGESAPPFKDGSGRLELARAIASPDNPLTARVFVNRAWMLHFGQGLVRTPSDFGVRSDPPTHPELLDWLARRFVADAWSIKKLHKLLMTSAVYRQASGDVPAYREADPENRLLWRMNRKRLEFEALRDSLLAVTGEIDLAVGGRPVPMSTNPTIKQRMDAETIRNEGGGDPTQEAFSRRRSIYLFIDRQNLPGTFRAFDFAGPDTHSPQRFQTTVPQQALFLMNSPFVLEQAAKVAARPDVSAAKDPAGRVGAMYRALYGRAPAKEELETGLRFVEEETRRSGGGLAKDASPWQYGHGRYDEAAKKVDFQPLPHFTGNSWAGGAKLPDPKLGWILLTAEGGHPGSVVHGAAIRRWTSPVDAEVSIEGSLGHRAAAGDGVRARIVSSRLGELASWTAHNTEAETKMSRVEVKQGDVLDFVVECRKDENSDSFTWAPVIRTAESGTVTGGQTTRLWSASAQFAGPPGKPKRTQGPWERYAQALLMSNEFMFVD
jgi:mono/diheme cytochrome c family protein